MQVRGALCWLEAARACLVSLTTKQRAIGLWVISGARLGGGFFPATRFRVLSICKQWVLRGSCFNALLKTGNQILGRSQVVRHRSLEPAFVGSNPPAPAISLCDL